uniref:Uncharacterized protein n=1 Tax=Melopsittacus undulatus TaxID=13146 RepID=A0A8V5GLD0_MELUD
ICLPLSFPISTNHYANTPAGTGTNQNTTPKHSQGLPHTHTHHKRLFPTRSTDPSPNWKPQPKTGRKRKAGKEGRGSQTALAPHKAATRQQPQHTARSTPQHWHNHPRQQLLNSLDHYIHHLKRCLSGNTRRFQSRGPRNLLLNINKYIHGVTTYLQDHNYSACAWDHVRHEAHTLFRHLDTLFRRMRS